MTKLFFTHADKQTHIYADLHAVFAFFADKKTKQKQKALKKQKEPTGGRRQKAKIVDVLKDNNREFFLLFFLNKYNLLRVPADKLQLLQLLMAGN